MNNITNLANYFTNYLSTTKDINPTFYTVDPNTQWKHFNFDKLTKEQCQTVHQACLNEARFEYIKSIGYATLAVFSAAAIIITAVFLSKVAIFLLGYALILLNFFIPIAFTSLISTDLSTALLAFYAIKTIWAKCEARMKPHEEYAKHLYQQAEHLFKQAKAAEVKILALTPSIT